MAPIPPALLTSAVNQSGSLFSLIGTIWSSSSAVKQQRKQLDILKEQAATEYDTNQQEIIKQALAQKTAEIEASETQVKFKNLITIVLGSIVLIIVGVFGFFYARKKQIL